MVGSAQPGDTVAGGPMNSMTWSVGTVLCAIMAASLATDRVGREALDKGTMCAIGCGRA